MAQKYLGSSSYIQDYNLLNKIYAITGKPPYSVKRVAILLAKDLGIDWPLETRFIVQLAKSFGIMWSLRKIGKTDYVCDHYRNGIFVNGYYRKQKSRVQK